MTRIIPPANRECKSTNLKTFVDDIFMRAHKRADETFKNVVDKNLKKINEYMIANKMKLNPDKTTVMLITKDNTKKDFKIEIEGK